MPVKTKAAILWGRNTPWSVEEIELDPPKAGEVLVKMAASGMCHSDEHLVTGDLAGATPEPPLIGGHEGAGVVLEVGAGVFSVKPGDHVVITGSPGRNPADHRLRMRTIFRPKDGWRWGGVVD